MNKKIIVGSLLLVVVVMATIFLVTNENSTVAGKPFFLKCLGDYAVVGENGDINLSLIFIDSNTNPVLLTMLTDKKIAFNDDNVNIEKIDITKGDYFGDIALYSLDLKLHIDKAVCLCEELILLDNDGGVDEFNIGKIAIHNNSQMTEGIEVTKNTGISSRLNRYEESLKNMLDGNVEIKRIETGQFSGIIDSISYSIPNENIEQADFINEEVELLIDNTVDITINFDSSDYYIYNPKIVYDVNGIEHSVSPFYATYGLSYNDEQMEQFEYVYSVGSEKNRPPMIN